LIIGRKRQRCQGGAGDTTGYNAGEAWAMAWIVADREHLTEEAIKGALEELAHSDRI
jgi:hypothetical protein